MPKYKQPDGLAPGIYLDLDDETYHGDKALSHSGMKDILVSELDYWWKGPLNPQRQFKETEAMKFGSRCHMLLLEEDKFFETYNISGMKYNPKKKVLSRTDYQKMKEAVDMIKSDPETHAYFMHGYPEVAIVWIDPETGIRLRAKIDYLRTFGCIDYKRNKDIESNPLGWHIANHGYDLQCQVYKEGLKQVKKLLRQGKAHIHGDFDPEWLKAFANDTDSMFVFLFQRTEAPYVYRILHFDKEIMDNAKVRVSDAIHRYKNAIETYGQIMWPAGKAEPEEFSIYHLPRKIFDQGVR